MVGFRGISSESERRVPAFAAFGWPRPTPVKAPEAPRERPGPGEPTWPSGPGKPPQVDATIAELKLYGDRVTTAHAVREQHGKDISYHEAHLPDAVVFAESAEEVQQIVQLCARHKTPIIAFGTGTSLEGHISAPNGGISLDLSRMNKVLQVNEADLDVVVQPGVTRKQLNEYLRATGLFFPIDPGADASIGGMASTRASGTNAVRYGTMRENVLALQVVTADGRLMRLGRALAQVERGLRPGEAVRRLRGHARHHHRDHAAALRHPRIDGRRRPAPSTRSRARSTP